MKSVSEEEFVQEQLRKGIKGHLSEGVWWHEPFHFYSKPIFEFRAMPPGDTWPARSRSWLGFSHHVPEAHLGNRFMEYMILEGEELRRFDLDRIPGKKRNQVRKGLKSCEVRPIDDLVERLEDIRFIYISQSLRHTEHYDLPDTPPTFYSEHAELWRKRELDLLMCKGREVWGAFISGKLAAFLVTSQIENIRFIEKVKSHTDFLVYCPADALYYSVLKEASDTGDCQRVVNPGIRGEGLEHYKKQFLFKRTAVPIYLSRPQLYRAGEQMFKILQKFRMGFKRSRLI